MSPFSYWTLNVGDGLPYPAISASFHSVAILCTFFRLGYQCHTARLWWDDAWATLALLADVACLVVTALEQPIPGGMTIMKHARLPLTNVRADSIPRFFEIGEWIFSLAYPILIWCVHHWSTALGNQCYYEFQGSKIKYFDFDCTGVASRGHAKTHCPCHRCSFWACRDCTACPAPLSLCRTCMHLDEIGFNMPGLL